METEPSPRSHSKRNYDFSASIQLPKKRKLHTGSDARSLRDKVTTWREQKRSQLTFLSPDLPSIFSNEGPPVVITAQSPSNRVLRPSNFTVCSEESEVNRLNTTVKELRTQVEKLTQRVVAAENYRKLLYAHIMDLKGAVRVMCRIKPCFSLEKLAISYPEAELESENYHTLTVNLGFSRLNFTCDHIFPESTQQTQVFTHIQSYIQAAIDGQHVSILAYGASDSGKTYTLEGNESDFAAGVLPRTANYLFETLKQQTNVSLRILMGCLYISDDYLQDLLGSQDYRLAIKSLGGKVVVDLLSWHEVASPMDMIGLWRTAKERRKREKNSHCVFQIVLEGSDVGGNVIEGQINIVELAGAEQKEGTEGKWIEATFAALKKVVSSRLRPAQVPCLPAYRDSKLTRILQDSLSTGKVLLLLTISSESAQASLTRQTLAYASELQTL